jgi:flap endonuclease-1
MPIFILDGKSGDEKKHTIEKRQNIKHKAKLQIQELELELSQTTNLTDKHEIRKKIYQLCRKCQSLTKQHIKIFKNILTLLSIPYIHCKGEADGVCSSLVKQGFAEVVMTNDTDIITYGCPRTFQNFDFTDNTINDIVLDDLLQTLGISYYQFVDMCIILGNDYNPPLFICSPQYALKCIKQYVTIENIIANLKEITKNKNYHVHIPKNFDYVKIRKMFINSENHTNIKDNVQESNYDKITSHQLFYGGNILKLKKFLQEHGLSPQQINDKIRFLRQVVIANHNRYKVSNTSVPFNLKKLQLFLQ